MGLAYCTVDDVVGVAQDYRTDITPATPESDPNPYVYNSNTMTIPRVEVEELIFEASDIVRLCLQPRYSIATIDAMFPDFPPIVIYLTKVQAAIYLYERYGSQSVELSKEKIALFKKSMQPYYEAITNGALLDNLGRQVKQLTTPSLLQGGQNNNYPAIQELQTIYTFGRLY